MIRILVGHILDKLRELPDESVHCVVTSPPYYGLRSYGTEPQIWGGDPECQHDFESETLPVYSSKGNWQQAANGTQLATGKVQTRHGGDLGSAREKMDATVARGFCRHCRAWKGDLGLESTLDDYLDHMVEIFREVRRVLRKDGTCWLNIGDSYASGSGGDRKIGEKDETRARKREQAPGFKPKDLMLIPSRLAIRLCDDGWWVRSDIAWCKRAPMPESCTDRPTTAWEHVFLLTKSGAPTYWTHRDHAGSRTKPAPDYRIVDRKTGEEFTLDQQPEWRNDRERWSRINLWQAHDYFYDQEAVKEEASDSTLERWGDSPVSKNPRPRRQGFLGIRISGESTCGAPNGKRNLRNFWLLGPEPFPEAHFATFVTEIPRIAIKAGTSEKGVCPKCGAPWERVVKKSGGTIGKGWHNHAADAEQGQRSPNTLQDSQDGSYKVETIGWQPTCSCAKTCGKCAVVCEDCAGVVAATVLDPFLGSGTTALVADQLQRDCIGIELNPAYADMARARIAADAPLLAKIAARN